MQVNPALSKEELNALKTFSLDLTEACRKCHVVSNASILRVQKDQRVLRRSEFNHRAHILQRRCLDCHNKIPIADLMKTTAAIDPEKDRSAIQNLPLIQDCKSCHAPDLVSQRCVTCHEFHPDKSRTSRMLLYLD
jgi:hypothetical protein